MIPLPHPSGASPWHKIAPGNELLRRALKLIARHSAVAAKAGSESQMIAEIG
jgi:uracil-DNA glycosylase